MDPAVVEPTANQHTLRAVAATHSNPACGCDGVEVVIVGWWRVEERVGESEYDEWVDPGTGECLSSPGKPARKSFPGGGVVEVPDSGRGGSGLRK
ncbi:hypothetical protein Tco_1131450 [Tanacetum coccineum]